MAHDPRQVAVLVRAMVAKHGHQAPKVAADRVRMWKKVGDSQTARLWTEVVELAATVVMARSNRGLERKQ